MARPRSDYRALHAAADAIEPRLARTFLRSAEKLRAAVSTNALAMALAARDVRAALALLTKADAEDAMSPAGTILRDTTLRGGRVGAELVNKARGH